MQHFLLAFVLALTLSANALAVNYTSIVGWDVPHGVNGEELEVQTLMLVFQVTQNGQTWTQYLSPQTGYVIGSHDGYAIFQWDDTFGGRPSPPSWFRRTQGFTIKWTWLETQHSPLINSYITFIVDGSVTRTYAAGATTHWMTMPLDVLGPY